MEVVIYSSVVVLTVLTVALLVSEILGWMCKPSEEWKRLQEHRETKGH